MSIVTATGLPDGRGSPGDVPGLEVEILKSDASIVRVSYIK